MATEGIDEPPSPEVLAEIQGVIAKAKAGDASVLPLLRAILDRHPGLSRHYGDLGRHAESAWIALAAGPNLHMKETLTREAKARRAELTRPGAPPVEALLVQRVVATGLQLDYLTAAEADALGAGDTYRQLQYHSKRIERAQRMYFTAVAALTTFQKLVPAAHVVAESANTVLAAPTQSERTAEQPPTPTVAERVLTDDADIEEERPETHDRLRVGVTC